jgi:hypothetical protein
MTFPRVALRTSIFATAALLTACGGGGGGTAGGGGGVIAGIDRGGITISSGAVTGFGSVHVNGVHYSTTGATFTIDGKPGTESDLRVGQVVVIEGKIDATGTTGTAMKVAFDDEVEGPVASIDLGGSKLVVLGRTVRVGTATSFDDAIVPRSLDGLKVGDRIEVSGFVAADGSVDATRIERKAAQASVEVKGTVAALDTAARRFTLGTLTVSYAAAQLDGFASGQPANGDRVEATGSVDGSGVLQATRVQRNSDGFGATSGERAEIEGLITRFVSLTDFSVAGQRVTTNATTTYEGGSAASLARDTAVEVEGKFDATGIVVASKVKVRPSSDTEFEGAVDAVDPAAGTFRLLGITFRVNAVTRYEDHSSADLTRFSLANVTVGDYLEVDAYNDGTGLVATKVERDDSPGAAEVQLEGVARDLAPPGFTIAGVSVTTNANTEFRDNNGATISASAFFAVASGQNVKVQGTQLGSTVLARRAELHH